MVIGITGSSGAGKSTICRIFETKYMVKVIDADEVAKKLSRKGTNYIIDIIKTFGEDIVDEEGELKRKKLAEIIYSDKEKRETLNKCTFKHIKDEIMKQIKKVKDNSTAIIIDAPLLFEAELDKICDKVIGVISNKELQVERIVARDNIDYEQAEKRLSAQASNEFYKNKCDVIVENNNNFQHIENKIKEIAIEFELTKKTVDKGF